jgi:hypothetical protein
MTWVNSLSEGERWAAGLVVVGLGIFVTHHFAMRRERLSTKRNASMAFRTAILSALSDLYPEPVNWPNDIDNALRQLFPSLQSAIAQFRPFLPPWRRQAFDRAWFQYRCSTGRKIDVQCYHHYMAFGGTDAQGNFRRNVDALLSFAY